MNRKTIDYDRLGVEACEAFTEGPEAFADYVRTILSIAAPVHALQKAMCGAQPDPLNAWIPLSETRH
jgi:hypothetical protein